MRETISTHGNSRNFGCIELQAKQLLKLFQALPYAIALAPISILCANTKGINTITMFIFWFRSHVVKTIGL